LLAFTEKKEPAREAYDGLAKEFPKSWEPEAGMAELTWGMRKQQEARTHFARAVELGSTDPRVYFDYAMVLREVKQKNGPPLFR
jgi:predicted Zn-dependent protease